MLFLRTLAGSGSHRVHRGRRATMLAVCVLMLAGCGSSSHHSPSSQRHSSSTPATTTASSTTTTPSNGEVASKLDRLPQATRAKARLPQPAGTGAGERRYLTAVFADAQQFWQQELTAARLGYQHARLTLFTKSTHSGCGQQSDTGPFYCGADRTVYLDLGFMSMLQKHAGVGPFGMAFIVAHELGHHVQHLLAIDRRVAALNQHNPGGENALSVRVELQADCLAGVWGHSSFTRGQLSDTDLQHALKTAHIVGDDFQQTAAGRLPDASLWTHGSSAQRQRWLLTGFDSGRPNSCGTFTSS